MLRRMGQTDALPRAHVHDRIIAVMHRYTRAGVCTRVRVQACAMTRVAHRLPWPDSSASDARAAQLEQGDPGQTASKPGKT
jgi:hypothetical protein